TSGWNESENKNDNSIPSTSGFTRIRSDGTLPEVRNKPGQHLPRKGLRSACYFCRYIRIRVEGKAVKSECRTQIWCKWSAKLLNLECDSFGALYQEERIFERALQKPEQEPRKKRMKWHKTDYE
ncbi:435_t:CDS:2, partial [Entrophospora sp. SA101]